MEVSKYSLYNSFNLNISTSCLTKKQKSTFVDIATKLTDNQKEAFVRLILEHVLLENGHMADVNYTGDQIGDHIKLDIDKFPQKLQWILWKFLNMCETIRQAWESDQE